MAAWYADCRVPFQLVHREFPYNGRLYAATAWLRCRGPWHWEIHLESVVDLVTHQEFARGWDLLSLRYEVRVATRFLAEREIDHFAESFITF